jgi:NTP pyrophosphatase (non-canonical NTP hydrolase)
MKARSGQRNSMKRKKTMNKSKTTFTLEQLQTEHTPWVLHNFHKQDMDHSNHSLFGIIEEIHELFDAAQKRDHELVVDSVGDIMIFMSDYCSCLNVNLTDLDNRKAVKLFSDDLLCVVGHLAHHQLKIQQNIRGAFEVHRKEICKLLRQIISHCRWYGDLEAICEKVWGEVKKRDWKKFPFDGLTS